MVQCNTLYIINLYCVSLIFSSYHFSSIIVIILLYVSFHFNSTQLDECHGSSSYIVFHMTMFADITGCWQYFIFFVKPITTRHISCDFVIDTRIHIVLHSDEVESICVFVMTGNRQDVCAKHQRDFLLQVVIFFIFNFYFATLNSGRASCYMQFIVM